MNSFLSKFRSLVAFVLVGFDRLRLCGESRLLNHPRGVASYAFQRRVPRRDFPQHTKQLTDQLDHDTREQAEREGVPVKHVLDAGLEKDALALKMAAERGIARGRIALLTAQENGMTYRPRKIGDDWGLRKEMVRCNHFYHYFLDDIFGLCYVRMQTYFPFTLRIGLNGRHWLARELTRRGVKFRQHRNLITAVEDVPLAQELLDAQGRANWTPLLENLIKPVHPLWNYLHDEVDTPYYWMAEQSELATDVVFKSAEDLALWYPRWVRHGLEAVDAPEVLRYFGRKNVKGCSLEAKIDYRDRVVGSRVKFHYDSNSAKFYNKENEEHVPICLRTEFTQNNHKGFFVFRTKEGESAKSKPSRQMLRKGVADLSRRAEIGKSVNNRVLESLATVADTKPLGKLLAPLGQPVVKEGRRVARPLNPLVGADGDWIRTLAKGDFLIQGFRNRDLREVWMPATTEEPQRRRQSAQVTRRLTLLRHHGIIKKIPKTHRYTLTAEGKRIATALLAAHTCDTNRLTAA